jgi:hypothetical protein
MIKRQLTVLEGRHNHLTRWCKIAQQKTDHYKSFSFCPSPNFWGEKRDFSSKKILCIGTPTAI